MPFMHCWSKNLKFLPGHAGLTKDAADRAGRNLTMPGNDGGTKTVDRLLCELDVTALLAYLDEASSFSLRLTSR